MLGEYTTNIKVVRDLRTYGKCGNVVSVDRIYELDRFRKEIR